MEISDEELDALLRSINPVPTEETVCDVGCRPPAFLDELPRTASGRVRRSMTALVGMHRGRAPCFVRRAKALELYRRRRSPKSS